MESQSKDKAFKILFASSETSLTMKRPLFSAALISIASLFPLFAEIASDPVRAIEPDYPCYMRTAVGEVTNLTESVCRQKQANADSSQDQAFLNDYRRLNADNDISQSLASDDPQLFISTAHTYCNGRRSGLSTNEIKAAEVWKMNSDNPDVHESVIASITSVNDLAQKYYCPDLAPR